MVTNANFIEKLDGLGYYSGAEFETPEQVREYLKEANQALFQLDSPTYSDDDLKRLGDFAIERRENWAV